MSPRLQPDPEDASPHGSEPSRDDRSEPVKRLIFLHIPKTAGQSVHQALQRSFGKEAVAPVRINGHLRQFSERDLLGYTVYSGHLDWNRFDFLPEPKRYVTVLRDPLERICSLYLFFLKNSQSLSESDMEKPARKGLALVRRLSIDEYFEAMDGPERHFLRDQYDNFYTYYFAGRRYLARRELHRKFGRRPSSDADIVQAALRNLRSIDYVADVGDLDGLSQFVRDEFSVDVNLGSRKANVNKEAGSRSRYEIVASLAKNQRTLDRLQEMVAKDYELLSLFRGEAGGAGAEARRA